MEAQYSLLDLVSHTPIFAFEWKYLLDWNPPIMPTYFEFHSRNKDGPSQRELPTEIISRPFNMCFYHKFYLREKFIFKSTFRTQNITSLFSNTTQLCLYKHYLLFTREYTLLLFWILTWHEFGKLYHPVFSWSLLHVFFLSDT